ncbi:MAG: HEAT repeat domain-containing protein [Thermoguttaceae bacterium]|jgi:hypothetical protein
MHYRHLAQIVSLALLMGLLGGMGCSSAAWRKVIPHPAPKTDVVPGLVPPHEQISTLRRQRDAAWSLSSTDSSRLASELANRCAQEQDPLIRAEIVKTLGALGTSEGRAAIRAAMQDSNSDVREAACDAWGGIADEEAVSELARVLSSDVDEQVRFAAAKALGRTRGPQAVAALGSVLEDRDPAMQYVAMESLRKSTGQNFGHDARLWRQYVRGETPARSETSVVSKFRSLF